MSGRMDYDKLARERAGSAEPGGPTSIRRVTAKQRAFLISLYGDLDEHYPGISPSMSRAEASELISNLLQRKRAKEAA